MSMLTGGTWVLVADGEKALFARNLTDAQNPNLQIIRHIEQDNPPTREQGTGRPGRTDIGNGLRAAVEETDWHRLAKDRFADELADLLYRMAHRGDFERIVIVAPPRILGELRRVMHKEVTERVVAELPKELTGHPMHEIEELLMRAV
ncbi:MAG: host attachment protein [Alphaproteobacteria bacterium]|nr:MAG: host attachment protein [Alphaproteobacteria bacterium]